ncbi:exosortase/archaeosortase family protein [Aureliella helgolandensis]|uniref:exosortase/archaeosortase family protein n=1 Tax=Aureliella helgolandensis TaxID=2527968 RepID=UPI001E39A7B3|nr:exosortase/archaeosortase family protein [Aureliella helgolandensis]
MSKKKRSGNKRKVALAAQAIKAAEPVKPAKAPKPAAQNARVSTQAWSIVAALLTILTLWAYWPTFVWMEDQWRNEPDYSHGYLVIPLALAMLYLRRDSMPHRSLIKIGWGGLLLLLVAIGLRVLGRLAYMDFLDGWTLVPWVAGLVWLFAGRRLCWWALPAIVFLALLTPMPFRAESLLSFKLQGLATVLSTGVLQTMGFTAVPEGNTIWLGEQQLMVEEACSGLRIFMGMAALGYFFAVLSDRSWIDRVVILVSCLPIAIFVNVLRVTGTGLAYQWFPPALAHHIHDFLGIAMIVAGATCLFGVKQYWEHLYRPVTIPMLQKQLSIQ